MSYGILAILLSQPQKHELNVQKEESKANKHSILSDLLLKHTRISIHFLSKNFVLVNALKIQTYGNQFLLAFRVVLPVLADNL